MTRGDAQEWLAHAAADLRYARLGQKDAESLAHLVVFHARQAVEKALKAVLVGRETEFPKTHDLEQLVELIEKMGTTWPAALNPVLEFTTFATQGRYPGFDDPISGADVAEAIAMAENDGGEGVDLGKGGGRQGFRDGGVMKFGRTFMLHCTRPTQIDDGGAAKFARLPCFWLVS